MNIEIEIASANRINKKKGDLLEGLAEIIFQKKGYKVVKELRRTGMEIDVSARDIKTNEKIYIECKAHKDSLPSEIISKIIGNKVINHYDLGILVTTGPLSKDALGMIEKMDEESHGNKKDFCVYDSEDIINLLISNGVIKNNLSLQGIDKINNIVSFTLLITEMSYYWLIKLHPNNINIANVIVLYDAKTGEPINNKDLLNKVYETDNSFKDYEWQTQDSILLDDSKLTNEYDNIIPVSMGDDWFDTRPARPIDFVGHEKERKRVLKLYNDVLHEKTSTRVFALLSPSGMGKSSLVLKIKQESELKFSNKIFNFNVDVRSATSEKYVETVVLKALKNMKEVGFVDIDFELIKFSNLYELFQNVEVKKVIDQLKVENKLIVLFFDQFEEIISKKEFARIFENAKNLSLIIESLQANVIIGFAWKTDFNIASDHPAYSIWNQLKDHRLEFYIPKFNKQDSKECLSNYLKCSKFKNLGELISKYIIDESNGFPWLLKKFCIHLENNYENVDNQVAILTEGFKIEKIFEQDMMNLSDDEVRCICAIAKQSPADYFEILENYDDRIVKNLIDLRLAVKKGGKIILYWDIFKDFINTGKVPEFEMDLIPITPYNSFIKAIQIISNNQNLKVNDFAEKLGIKENSAMNIVVDLAKFDLIVKDGMVLRLKQADLRKNIEQISNYMSKHVLIKQLKQSPDKDYEMLKLLFQNYYPYSGKTLDRYLNKLYVWFKSCGIINFDKPLSLRKSNCELYYYIESTYNNVKSLLENINISRTRQSEFTDKKKKQIIKFLQKIEAIKIYKDLIVEKKDINYVVEKIQQLPPYELVQEFMLIPHIKHDIRNLSLYLKDKLNPFWTPSAARRYANWLHSWFNRIKQLRQQSFFDS